MVTALRKTSVADEVFNLLHSQISSGELPVGHRLPPQEVLAEQLQVSRSTIREAVNKLIVLGLLAAKPGVGTMVVETNPAALVSALGQHLFLRSGQVAEFMEARLYLEKAALRLAILKASNQDMDQMSELLVLQEKAFRLGDAKRFSELDARFHQTIIESSRNRVLMEFLGLLQDGLSQFILEVTMLESAMRNALQYHLLLLGYLKTRNLVKAESTLLQHLHDVAMNIERNMNEDIGLKAMFQQELDFSLKGRRL